MLMLATQSGNHVSSCSQVTTDSPSLQPNAVSLLNRTLCPTPPPIPAYSTQSTVQGRSVRCPHSDGARYTIYQKDAPTLHPPIPSPPVTAN